LVSGFSGQEFEQTERIRRQMRLQFFDVLLYAGPLAVVAPNFFRRIRLISHENSDGNLRCGPHVISFAITRKITF
jgi:hypothetical protein